MTASLADERAKYQIRVQGQLDPQWSARSYTSAGYGDLVLPNA
jgi:hypothetical protein